MGGGGVTPILGSTGDAPLDKGSFWGRLFELPVVFELSENWQRMPFTRFGIFCLFLRPFSAEFHHYFLVLQQSQLFRTRYWRAGSTYTINQSIKFSVYFKIGTGYLLSQLQQGPVLTMPEAHQARSQDFCVRSRFEQKVDLFLHFFLSVKGGGCEGMLTRLCF